MFAIIVSCESDSLVLTDNVEESIEEDFNLEYIIEDDVLNFENESVLAENLNSKSYEEIREDVRSLRAKGFVPLNPMFDGNDNIEEEAYLLRRAKQAKENKNFLTNKTFSKEDADLEDDVVADPKFAAMLNEKREVIVGKKFYKYTPYGLFFSHKKDRKHLRDYIRNLSKSETGKSTISKIAGDCIAIQKGGGSSAKVENITAIDDKISVYNSCGGSGGPIPIGGGGSGGGTSGGTTSTNLSYPIEYKGSLSVCNVNQESVWQKIFGPAETCHDYFDSKKRVKVKFWSQSYLVYASMGMSTKYQKKYWLGWQTSNAIDYTELGINHASFTYKRKVSLFDKIFKDMQNDVIIRWKNQVWTGDGRRLTNIPFELPKWPFETGDVDKFTIEVYINKNINFEYTSKDAYKDILKVTKNLVKTYGKKLDGLFEAAQQDKLVMKGVALVQNADKMIVTVNERYERDYNDCCATHVLDRNFLVELKIGWSKGNFQVEKNPGGAFVTSGETVTYIGNETPKWSPPIPVPKLDVFNATKYEDFSIDFYGVSKRDGTTFKGKRMLGSTKDL